MSDSDTTTPDPDDIVDATADDMEGSKGKNDSEAEGESKPSPSHSVPGRKNITVFKDSYYIDLSIPIDKYSYGEIRAYPSGTSESKMEGYFAVIGLPYLTVRTNIMKFYKELNNGNMPSLVNSGRVQLPNKSYAYCLIYRDNLGERLYKSDENIALGWDVDSTLEKVIIPIIYTLQSLQKRDVVHGNIRITNLYADSPEKIDKIRLGECLAVPPSYHQPVVYEPVERAMASPIGRGAGTVKDDLYALGVVAAMHVRNFDPMRGKAEDEIISSKVVHGSYASLIGGSDRIGSGISDLLRGLLSDDVKLRWSLDDVTGWLEGRKPNVKQSVKMKKAARAIQFDGTSFYYPQTFAYRFLKNPREAVHLIEGNELSHWVERSINNSDMTALYKKAFTVAKEGGQGVGYWDRLLSFISIALDPRAPIRYRTVSIHLNALGNAMAYAFLQKKGLANYIDLFNNGIITFWLEVMNERNVDVAEYVQTLDKIQSFLRQKGIINGVERVLYFMNTSLHCLSPLVIDYYATTLTEYLEALEQVAEERNGRYPGRIIDQHAACFIISRESKVIESFAFDLGSDLDYRYVMANLQVLAAIQKYEGMGGLPHLTKWVCSTLDPVFKRYHDKDQQQKLRQDIEKIKDNGDLTEIMQCIEDPAKVKKDQLAFRKAMIQYQEHDHTERSIAAKLENPKYFSEKTGQEWAATISGIVSALIIIGFLMVHYGTGAPM